MAINWNNGVSTDLMENPTDEYSMHFKSIMSKPITDLFKDKLQTHINNNDPEMFNIAKDVLIKDMQEKSSSESENLFVSTGEIPPFSLLYI